MGMESHVRQRFAIEFADKLASTVSDVLRRNIVELRRRLLRYQDIAEQVDVSAALAALGAQTLAVRESIVARVCQNTLSFREHQDINHQILQARPSGRERPEWNERIDARLLELAGGAVHDSGPHKGEPDIGRIASLLNKEFGLQLEKNVWKRRLQTAREHAARQPAV